MKKEVAFRPFEGFGQVLFDFLEELSSHQSREWFQANKPRYEEAVLEPLRGLIFALNREFEKRELPLEGDPRRSIFRIHRDVRFSADKQPFKTHAAATMTRDASRMSQGMLYLHLAPEECFAAVGFYGLESRELLAIRNAIAADQEGWLLIEKMAKRAGYPFFRRDPLKRLPRGFELSEVEAVAEALKLRTFVVRRALTREEVGSRELVRELGSFSQKMLPLLEFGWGALG
jgi:uncharacterized protein (TIGR02453 family)